MDLHSLSPAAFCELLAREKVRRFYLVWDEEAGRVRASHPVVEPLARLIEDGPARLRPPRGGVRPGGSRDRESSRAPSSTAPAAARARAGSAIWRYDTVEAYLRDGLRLARGMTHKNALAGLWWGGGKGVMSRGTGLGSADPAARRRIYEEYGEFITSLQGCYVTAEDVGTSVEDMAAVFSRTRFTTCIPPALGGSGNPSVPTARGVVRGMEAALRHLGLGTLAGKTVAVQGLGHVGEPLVGFLAEKGVRRIVGSDIDPGRRELVQRFPCAGPGGPHRGARGQFDPRRAGRHRRPLRDRRHPEPPDHPQASRRPSSAAPPTTSSRTRSATTLSWRSGTSSICPISWSTGWGSSTARTSSTAMSQDDPSIERHLGDTWDNSIFNLSLQVLEEARRSGRTPARMAVDLAEERSRELHPVWGHRGAAIIRSLVRTGWAGTG